jgi:hypothetical protein
MALMGVVYYRTFGRTSPVRPTTAAIYYNLNVPSGLHLVLPFSPSGIALHCALWSTRGRRLHVEARSLPLSKGTCGLSSIDSASICL